jgi:selenocysteine lyase/cysteine desulfurase
VVGAVALHAAIESLGHIGWEAIVAHERALAERLCHGLRSIPGVHLLGPLGSGSTGDRDVGRLPVETLPVAAFTVDGIHHALVAARLSAEHGIAVRHGCFCAHPYVVRLLGLADREVSAYRSEVLRGDHRNVPGAVRASAGLGSSGADIDTLLAAVGDLAGGAPPPVPYKQDPATGDFFPVTEQEGWRDASLETGAACARG